MTTPIRLLIADDDALVRGGLGMLLGGEEDLEVVGEAANGFEAIRLARETRPDVVLMDVRMPELDGIAATRRIVTGAEPAPACWWWRPSSATRTCTTRSAQARAASC